MLDIILAILASALIAYNNSVIVAGPMISIGVRRIFARLASGLSIALGALILGSAMRSSTACGFGEAIEAYISIIFPTLLSTYFSIPFSASIGLIGVSIGEGLSKGALDPLWLVQISLLWLFSGVFLILISLSLYIALRRILSLLQGQVLILGLSRIITTAISILSGILLGANTLGFLSSLECHRLLLPIALGGLAAAIPSPALLEGVFRWFSVRHLSITSIGLSIVLAISIATYLGLPLSHTYALVFSLIGYSIASGISIFSRRSIMKLARTWIYSLAIGIGVTFILAMIT
ncbi:MAG TPA: hypothetical protein VNL13_03575 [Sulfolobales archaeon]|nr:hypothetical protein [Sulfolobales archaeon]